MVNRLDVWTPQTPEGIGVSTNQGTFHCVSVPGVNLLVWHWCWIITCECVCVCVYVCVVWLCMYIYVCVCVVCVFVLCVFCVYGYVESSDMEIESFAEHWRNVTSSSWQTWSADRLNKNKFDKIQTFWNEHVVTSSWQLKINKLICLSAVFLKQKAIPTC